MLTRRTFAAALPLVGACQNGAQPAPQAGAAPTWRSAPATPYAVQEIYPALHANAIWVAGGFAPLNALGATHRVVAFDLARQDWVEGPALPTPSHHVQLASLNGELFAIGGFLGGDNRRRWICTPRVLKLAGDAWIEGPALPKPVAEGVPIVHLNRIHLIGGRSPRAGANAEWDDQIDVDDHFVLGVGETEWSRAAPLPIARNSAAGVSDGDRLHVISGRTVANGQTAAHHIYDPRTGVWENGPDYPDARGGLAAAFWRGRVVAGGGEIFDPPSVGATLHEFDAASGWRAFETMPVSRHGHGIVAAGDALYFIGGARNVSAQGTMARLDVLL